MQVLYSSGRLSETLSVATLTSIEVRLDISRACQRRAGTSPRSSSIEGRKRRDMLRTTPTVFSTSDFDGLHLHARLLLGTFGERGGEVVQLQQHSGKCLTHFIVKLPRERAPLRLLRLHQAR